jgi:CHAT domain-containing protein/tetratricopeptide (TPR) repeat protein
MKQDLEIAFRTVVLGLLLGSVVAARGPASGAIGNDDPPHAAKPDPYAGLSEGSRLRLKERDAFEQWSRQLIKEKKFAEAIEPTKRMLALEYEVLGLAHADVVRSLDQLVKLHVALGQYTAAHREAVALLDVSAAVFGPDHWQVTQVRIERDLFLRVLKLDQGQRRRLNTLGPMQARAAHLAKSGRHLEVADLLRSKLVIYKDLLGEESAPYVSTLGDLGLALQRHENHIGASPWFEEAARLAKVMWGEVSPNYARVLGALAPDSHQIGDLKGSREQYMRALEIRQRCGLERDAEQMNLLEGLVRTLRDLGRPDQAQPYAEQALELASQLWGEHDIRYAEALDVLGEVLYLLKDLAGARRIYEREKSLRRELVGEQHPKYAYCLNRLGRILQDKGDLEGAEALYRQAISIFPQTHRMHGTALKIGETRFWTNEIFDNIESLAVVRRAKRAPERDSLDRRAAEARGLGDFAAAIRLLAERNKLIGEDFGPLSDQLVAGEWRLALLQVAAEEFDGAKKTLRHVENILGFRLNKHWQTTEVWLALTQIDRLARLDPARRARVKQVGALVREADNRERARQYPAAVKNLESALRLQREIRGEDHPLTPMLLDRLGMALLAAGDSALALKTLQSALALSQKTIGEQLSVGAGPSQELKTDAERTRAKQEIGAFHPDTLMRACHVMQALHALGQEEQAKKLIEQSLLFRKLAAAREPGTLRMRYDEYFHPIGSDGDGDQLDLVVGLSDGRSDKDVAANEALLAMQRAVLGQDHPSVAETLDWLAERHERRVQYDPARRVRREALDLKRRLLGEGHWEVIEARLALENVERLAELDALDLANYRQGQMLWKRADSALERGQLEEAFDRMQTALSAYRKALGEKHPRYADGLVRLGDLLRVQGDLIGAEPLLAMGLQLREETFTNRHPATVRARFVLGKLKVDKGQYARGEELISSASVDFEALFGPKYPDYISTLEELASVYLKRGKYREARTAIERAMELAPSGRLDEMTRRLNLLAQVLNAVGEHANARRQIESVAKFYPGRPKFEDHPLVKSYLQAGDTVKAKQAFENAVKMWEENTAPELADALSTLARSLRDAGDYAGAKLLMERVLGVHYQDPQGDAAKARGFLDGPKGLSRRHPLYAARLQELAELLLGLGDLDRASPLFDQALALTEELLGPEHPQCALRLIGKARVLAARHDLDGARRVAERALALSSEAYGEGHFVTTEAARILARIHLSKGEPALARTLLASQVEAARAASRDAHPDQPGLLAELAAAQIAVGDIDQARPLLDRALALNASLVGPDHPSHAAILDHLVLWQMAKGNTGGAREAATQALKVRENYLVRNITALSERELLAALGELHTSLSSLLSLDSGSNTVQEDYGHLVSWKGVTLSAGIARRESTAGPELRERVAELNRARSRIQQFYYAFPQGQEAEDSSREFRELIEQRARLEAELARVTVWQPERYSPERVTLALPAKTTLVDLFRFSHMSYDPRTHTVRSEFRYAAFVLRQGKPPTRIDLGPAEPIERLVDLWRQRAQARGSDPTAVGIELAARVWKPLVSALGDATSIILAPDGPLGLLPWGALPDETPGSYLLERFTFGMVISARQLVELSTPEEKTRAAAGLLVVGDVDYDRTDDILRSADTHTALAQRAETGVRSAPVKADQLNFGRLAKTREEIDAIAGLFRIKQTGIVRELSGARATKVRLGELLPGNRYVHLATHGYFAPPGTRSALSPADPEALVRPFEGASPSLVRGYFPGLLSGLVFAGANAPPRNPYSATLDTSFGVVTAEEMAGFDLSGCELAVLSACQTGLGKLTDGEGVLSLQRAFHLAGAKTVVASLWTVDDDATQRLMAQFYDNLWGKNLAPAEAMRQAQLSLLRGESGASTPLERGPGAVVPSTVRDRARKPSSWPERRELGLWAGWVVSGIPRP